MESTTKRIVAIALIVVIGIGIGVGVWIFVAVPADPYTYPGAPSSHPNVIKLGMIGDTDELQGDANWDGAYMAAEEINTAGGVDVGRRNNLYWDRRVN